MTRIGILVFPDVEVLDFCGPFEVFSTTRLSEPRGREDPCPFEVKVVAETTSPVTATGGLKVIPDHDFASCPPLDVLVVAGGWGTREQVNNPPVIEWIRKQASGARFVTSVCTGSFLLAQVGLLAGKPSTTHWHSLDRMQRAYPDVSVDRERQVVEAGNVLTSAGIAAGIDLALVVVAKLLGEPVARSTARHMEYPYPEGTHRRVPVVGSPVV
jgi:transcriptional regulator GlxA family with amidase domain